MAQNPFRDLLGMRVISARNGEAVVTMPANPRLCNSRGVVHGGAICSLCDSAIGTAVRSTLQPEDLSVAMETKVNFLAPGRGDLQVRARVLRVGRSTAVGEAEVYGGGGEHLVAKALATYHVQRAARPPRPGATTALDPDFDGPDA